MKDTHTPPRSREAEMTDKTVQQYADSIMAMIDEDTEAGQIPATAASFQELHEHVDANEYLITAAVPWGEDDPMFELTNDVTDEVSRRLAERAPLTRGTSVRYWLDGDRVSEWREGVITEHYHPSGGNVGHLMVRSDDGTEMALSVNDVRIGLTAADA